MTSLRVGDSVDVVVVATVVRSSDVGVLARVEDSYIESVKA